MSTFRGVLTALLLLAGAIGYRTETSHGDEEIAEAKKASRDDCLKWIEQLASPKKPPFKGSVRRLPPGVTQETVTSGHRQVGEAYSQLSENVETALPLLAASLEDSRFSAVFENYNSGDYYCRTVGQLCHDIVHAHVGVYRPAVTKGDGEGRFKSLEYELPPGRSFATDLHQRKLSDLQLERIEWAFGQPQPRFFTEEEWKKAVDKLQTMAKQIRETGKPIPVKLQLRFAPK